MTLTHGPYSTQDKGSILSPQKIAEALILLQISLNGKHYCIQRLQVLKRPEKNTQNKVT